MISLQRIQHAGSAATYYAKDNFITAEVAEAHTEWWGKGADILALKGRVTEAQLHAVLEGRLPNGALLPQEKGRSAGFDMTFSPPKSLSILALVGDDHRLIMVHRQAVRQTLAWAQKHLAETRAMTEGQPRIVRTETLLVALIDHDMNRAQEPFIHTHAVIANITQGPDGRWRALHNSRLWKLNTVLGSIYNAYLRQGSSALGYETTPAGKHGSFEISGFSRQNIEAFSTRRMKILDVMSNLTHQAPKTAEAIALKTREHKTDIADRRQIIERWKTQAANRGLDLTGMVGRAKEQAAVNASLFHRLTQGLSNVIERLDAWSDYLAGRINGMHSDPLVPEKPGELMPSMQAAAQAVASAIRHLSQREAAWDQHQVAKTALDLHLPVTIEDVEKRITRLKAYGLLMPGDHRNAQMLTTPEAFNQESEIVARAHGAAGKSRPVLSKGAASERIQRTAMSALGASLNAGQEDAAKLILSSTDRYVVLQGIPGAGKTTMLKVVAAVLSEEGYQVIGLGHQNRLVRMLEEDTAIRSYTIKKYLHLHNGLSLPASGQRQGEHVLRPQKGIFLIVDEASMVSNNDKLKLMQIADTLGFQRVVFVGDKRQLGAIDAGKPFEIIQAAQVPTAQMLTNVRQKSEHMRAAAQAAHEGRIYDAMKALDPFMIETENPAMLAAARWLNLTLEERMRTTILASGRETRAALNAAVQEGLLREGTLGGFGLAVSVLEQVNLSREEERYVQFYKPGQRLEFVASLAHAAIRRGSWGTIKNVDHARGEVILITDSGDEHLFYPRKLAVNRRQETVRLYTEKLIRIHQGDRIRWTASDLSRGLYNASIATVIGIDAKGVLVLTTADRTVVLPHDDPMLKRIDLAYAVNAHMGQGLTTDNAKAVMLSTEYRLANQRLFLVNITRHRAELTLIVDNKNGLVRRIAQNSGDKTSALETTGRIGSAPETGTDSSGLENRKLGDGLPTQERRLDSETSL